MIRAQTYNIERCVMFRACKYCVVYFIISLVNRRLLTDIRLTQEIVPDAKQNKPY